MKKVFLLAGVLFTLAGRAQKVSNKLTFKKGQKLEVVAETKSLISQEVMGQKMDINSTSNLTRVFDIENVANGTATIEQKIKRIQFNVDMMGQAQSFDSEKEADLKGEMGKPMEKALKNKYTMMVDATGKITGVKADDDNPNDSNATAAADPMLAMMEQFGINLQLPKVGDASLFSILPAHEVSQGQTWVDSVSNNPDVKSKSTYTVSSLTATDIIVDYTQEAKVVTVQDNMGMDVNVTMETKAKGKITLDRKTGLLKQKTSTVEGSGTAEAGGQMVPLSISTSETITVKAS